MTRPTFTRRMRGAGAGLCLGALVITAAPLGAQSDPWLSKSPKLQMRALHDTAGRVRLDYPNKDWLVVPGGNDSIITLAEKRAEAAVFLQVVSLEQPLAPSEVTDLFAQIEIETIQKRDTRASDFTQRVIVANDLRVAVIEYSRQGVLGTERVRQYSYPIGNELYRLICSTPLARQQKYGSTFAHMAASLTVGR